MHRFSLLLKLSNNPHWAETQTFFRDNIEFAEKEMWLDIIAFIQ